MASFKLYLDTRTQRKDGTAPLKIAVHHRGRFLINLKVYTAPENFIDNEVVIPQSPARQKSINNYIRSRVVYVESTINKLMLLGQLPSLTDRQLKTMLDPNTPIEEDRPPSFREHYEKFIERRNAAGTVSVYRNVFKNGKRSHPAGMRAS